MAGGFTSVVAMPNTRPVNDSVLVTRLIRQRARGGGPGAGLPGGGHQQGPARARRWRRSARSGDAGCVAVTDDGRPVMSASLMRRVLVYTAPLGLPVMVHEEDLTLSAGGALTEGPLATRLGLLPIPRSAEVVMVARDLVLLEEVGGRLHVAHVSCAASVALLREAKAARAPGHRRGGAPPLHPDRRGGRRAGTPTPR